MRKSVPHSTTHNRCTASQTVMKRLLITKEPWNKSIIWNSKEELPMLRLISFCTLFMFCLSHSASCSYKTVHVCCSQEVPLCPKPHQQDSMPSLKTWIQTYTVFTICGYVFMERIQHNYYIWVIISPTGNAFITDISNKVDFRAKISSSTPLYVPLPFFAFKMKIDSLKCRH